MTAEHYRMPSAPAGYDVCRTMLDGGRGQATHLVMLDEHGSNGGRPTACGLTRFNDFTPDGRPIPNTAGLSGWGMGGGVSGPGVIQTRCADCYAVAEQDERTKDEVNR